MRSEPLTHFYQKPDASPFPPSNGQLDEGGDAYQVEARGRDVTARDRDRLNGLIDGASPDRMNLDAALTPDNSSDDSRHGDRFGGASHFEHLDGGLALTQSFSGILVESVLGRWAALRRRLSRLWLGSSERRPA
jgi:hypothetical protein